MKLYHNRALMVIDVQNGFINENTRLIPARIRELISSQEWKHIIFTRFINRENSQFAKQIGWSKMMGGVEIEIVSELRQYAEHVYDKNIYTAVNKDLILYLRQNDIGKIFITGIDTDICVLKNAVDLFEQGFESYVLTEYCMSHAGKASHDAALMILPRFIGKHYVVGDAKSFFRG